MQKIESRHHLFYSEDTKLEMKEGLLSLFYYSTTYKLSGVIMMIGGWQVVIRLT